eukprot:6196312-Pleurochrysis_carterae.AAC.2
MEPTTGLRRTMIVCSGAIRVLLRLTCAASRLWAGFRARREILRAIGDGKLLYLILHSGTEIYTYTKSTAGAEAFAHLPSQSSRRPSPTTWSPPRSSHPLPPDLACDRLGPVCDWLQLVLGRARDAQKTHLVSVTCHDLHYCATLSMQNGSQGMLRSFQMSWQTQKEHHTVGYT